MTTKNNIVLVFKTNGMGISENQTLRENLAKTFLTLANQMEPLPKVICFYRRGKTGL